MQIQRFEVQNFANAQLQTSPFRRYPHIGYVRRSYAYVCMVYPHVLFLRRYTVRSPNGSISKPCPTFGNQVFRFVALKLRVPHSIDGLACDPSNIIKSSKSSLSATAYSCHHVLPHPEYKTSITVILEVPND